MTLSNPIDPQITIQTSDVQIILVAIECRVKQEKEDEIYGSVSAIALSTHELKITHFPDSGDPFQMGADGMRIVMLQVPVYQGPFANIALACSLVEHDSGDIEKYKAELAKAVLSLASMGGTALGIPSEAFGANTGFANDVSRGLSNAVFSVIGADDDPFTPQTLLINATDMVLAKTNSLPRKHLKRGDDLREFDFTHSIILTGTDQGGDRGEYGLYFDLKVRDHPQEPV
jgi:hypothetical protein